MSPSTFRKFLFFKLPIAWLAGLRLLQLNDEKAVIAIRLHRWSQNPFKSIFWAVQGMAAEISTGILCINEIQRSEQKVSMLVVQLKAQFTKKAVGKIRFECTQGQEVKRAIQQVIESGDGVQLWLKSQGIDEAGDTVAQFEFCWSFKKRN